MTPRLVFDTTCLSHFARADRLRRFTVWTGRVGAGTRDLGEASVLAAAEELDAVALVDERDATRVGRAYGIEVHGTVWLLAQACRDGKVTEVGAGNLVDALSATGMRLPCTGAEFPRFVREHGLL